MSVPAKPIKLRGRLCVPLAMLSLISTTGCITPAKQWWNQRLKVGPEYCRPNAEVAPAWIDDDPAVIPAPMEFSDWWTVFGDPQLDELVQSVPLDNLQLKSATARIDAARSLTRVARSTLFPQVAGTAAFTHLEQSETTAIVFPETEYDTWSTGFNASWELDLWGRLRRANDAACANLGASVANRNAILVSLQGEMANAYLQMRTFQARLQILKENQELQEKTLQLAETRFNNGKVSELDVAQAKVNLNATLAAIPPIEEAIRNTQNGICVLLGYPPTPLDAELGVAPIPTPPENVIVGIPADLLRRRPDVCAAERNVKIQSELIGISEASLYPIISLNGSIGLESENLSSLFDVDSLTNSIGPSLQWNILTFGRQLALLEQSKANFREAVFDYRSAALAANQEVEDGIISFIKERERLLRLEETVASAQRSVQLANLQYEEGKVNFQRVIDTQRVLLQHQDALTASHGQVNINLVTIYRALGGGWQSNCYSPQSNSEVAVADYYTVETPTPEQERLPATEDPLVPPAIVQPAEPIVEQ